MVVIEKTNKRPSNFTGENIGVGRPTKYPFRQLDKGESFFAATYKNNLQKCAANYIRYTGATAKFEFEDAKKTSKIDGEKKTIHGVRVTRVK